MRRTQVLYLDTNRTHLNDVFNLITSYGYPIMLCESGDTLLEKLKSNRLGSKTRNITVDLFMFGELDKLYNIRLSDYGIRRADYLSSVLPLFPLRPYTVNITNNDPSLGQLVRLYEAGVDKHATKPLDKGWITEWLQHTAQPNYILPEVTS